MMVLVSYDVNVGNPPKAGVGFGMWPKSAKTMDNVFRTRFSSVSSIRRCGCR